MSAGAHLDDAAHLLDQAAGHLTAIADIDRYGLTAVISARDRLYRELGRFLAVLRVPAPGRALTLQDATLLIGEDSGGTVARSTVLATGIKAATLGLPPVARDLLRAAGSVSSLVDRAADAVSFTTEIIFTHVHPQASSMHGSSRQRYLTREGAALMAGAQHTEALGEAARLTIAAMKVDRQVVAHRWADPDVLEPHHWELLTGWATSAYPAALAQLGAADPADLLRQLQTAPVVERSSGPRHVGSWADALRTVAAARSSVRRQQGLATVGLARAAARLGFAANAASWRAAGTAEPTPRVAAHADRWRELAGALSTVADLRDSIDAPLVPELDHVKAWIRSQASWGELTAASAGHIAILQREVGGLCGDLRDPLRMATIRGDLMSMQKLALGTQTAGGIVPAVPQWATTRPSERNMAQMLHALATVADLPVPAAGPPDAGPLSPATSARDLTDQVALEAGLLAMSRTWPGPVRHALQELARHPDHHTDKYTGKPAAVRQDPAVRQEQQR
ncbi:MAG TPA: hypothetical protein DGT23_29815 [Micromonosporaceae bacterium]|nr:hypothetical protein [Micromonosporaceae bacterium]